MFTQSFYFKLNLTVLKTSFKNFYETYIFVLFDILSSKSFFQNQINAFFKFDVFNALRLAN